jgi:hypothetical protein
MPAHRVAAYALSQAGMRSKNYILSLGICFKNKTNIREPNVDPAGVWKKNLFQK